MEEIKSKSTKRKENLNKIDTSNKQLLTIGKLLEENEKKIEEQLNMNN